MLILAAAGCGSDSNSVPPPLPPPPPPPPPVDEVSLEGSFLGQRSAGSMECYTLHPDGTAELRHQGANLPTDVGRYSIDTATISWRSGRVSTLQSNGSELAIDSLALERIDTCTP